MLAGELCSPSCLQDPLASAGSPTASHRIVGHCLFYSVHRVTATPFPSRPEVNSCFKAVVHVKTAALPTNSL